VGERRAGAAPRAAGHRRQPEGARGHHPRPRALRHRPRLRRSARSGAAPGVGDRQAEEIRVQPAPEGRRQQRLALAVRLRSGARRVPPGDRGVLPVARQEAALAQMSALRG
jgi:hypothetical protein